MSEAPETTSSTVVAPAVGFKKRKISSKQRGGITSTKKTIEGLVAEEEDDKVVINKPGSSKTVEGGRDRESDGGPVELNSLVASTIESTRFIITSSSSSPSPSPS